VDLFVGFYATLGSGFLVFLVSDSVTTETNQKEKDFCF